VYKVYRNVAFSILKKYKKTLLGRRRLTKRLLDNLFSSDKQFYTLPYGGSDVIYDPYGEELQKFLDGIAKGKNHDL
jgi:hypothetical protein